MWLLVRFALAAIVAWVRARKGPWRSDGEALTGDGIAMRVACDRSKSRVTRSTLIADVGWPMRVAFRPESGWDRLLKAFGLVHEFQHGDPAFDARVFVECDDERFARALLRTPAACDAIMASLKRGADLVFCGRGQLGITWPNGDDPEVHRADLAAIAAAWSALPEVATEGTEPFAWRALVVECALWSLGTWAIVAACEQAWTHFPLLVSNWPAIKLGLAATIPLYALMVVLARLALGRSSHSPKVLLEVILVGALLAPFLACFSVFDLDIRGDSSPAQVVRTTVDHTHSYVTHGSRGSTTHHYFIILELGGFEVDDAQKSLVELSRLPTEIEVGSGLYHAADKGMRAELLVHRGALGLLWIEDLRLNGR